MTTPYTNDTVPLRELDDYKVADGAPDVRGWDVVGAGGQKLGKVNELLVSPSQQRVRYLAVELDRSIAGSRKDRTVLVPVGVARLDDKHDRVIVDSVTADTLATLPPYTGGRLTREYETRILDAFGGGVGATASGTGSTAAPAAGEGFYAGQQFNEDRFYGSRYQREGEARRIVRSEEELAIGKRQVQAGEVDVHKSVETEHVRKTVPVSREEVEVERRPIAADTRAEDATIQEGDIRVPIMEEEVVVEKRAVAKEEVVIRKNVVQDEAVVEEDVRRERIDVDDTTKGRSAGGTPAPEDRRDEAR